MDGWGFAENKAIMDVALGNYLYKLDGNSFQESYSLNCFSWYHTVTFTCEGGQCTNKKQISRVSYSKYYT
jgi:hypothetical protein